MTALDTAIIKAYLRQGGLAASDEVEPNETATPEAILNEADRAVPADRRRPSERSPAGAAPPLAVPLEALDLAEAFLTPNVDAPIDRADARTIAPGTTTKENEAASFATVGSPSSDVSPDSQDRPFEPMLRMDTVSWPRPSRRLRHVADRQIERLADTVQKAATTGRNLVGVTSCSHGEGCTTVLLAVALRLVELGSKTLLIDGDIGKPRLADQLALDSEAGWRDVASGHLPLEEVVTQYESESLAFLPYCGRATSFDSTPPPRRYARCLPPSASQSIRSDSR